MRIRSKAALCVVVLGLAACGNSDAERALSGAAIGGVGTAVLGGSVGLGAVVGAAAGILCDDVRPGYCLD